MALFKRSPKETKGTLDKGLEKAKLAGDPDAVDVAADVQYLRSARYFLEIFINEDMSVGDKVRRVGYVQTYYLAWRHLIENSTQCNLKEHFITDATYTDTLIALQMFVLQVKLLRDGEGLPASATHRRLLPSMLSSRYLEYLFLLLCHSSFASERNDL